jgi:hypothetical protein
MNKKKKKQEGGGLAGLLNMGIKVFVFDQKFVRFSCYLNFCNLPFSQCQCS